MRPNDRSYLESHEWAKLDGDIVTVGITDFAVSQLGELVYIDLPEVEDDAERGEGFGEVESVKAVSDINAPVDGEIVEVNEGLADDLGPLQTDPLGDGWLIRIKVSDPSALTDLLDAEAYESIVVSQS